MALCSANIFSVLFILFGLCSTTFATDFSQSECLAVPTTEYTNSVSSTINVIRKVISIVSQFSSYFGDFRLSNAITDCLDLLDISADELSWAVSASQNPKGKSNGTGDLADDLRTWMSAALANSDTCSDGFEGTDSIIKGIVTGSLSQVNSMVSDLLRMVEPPSKKKSNSNARAAGGGKGKPGRKLGSDDHFPSWVRPEDRKLLQVNGVNADVIVAADGSGNFTSIMDAIKVAPNNSMTRFVIYIKKGVYKENVEIKKKKWNLMMVGDGINATVISGNRSFIDGWTTFRSATFAVSGRGFIARDLTFENTAGPEKHQAVALRSDSDLSVFYRCGMIGYQDTLYTHTMRQFYRDCTISGTVDFIFGDAAAMFQNCRILARKGLPNQKNTITAQGRKDPNQPTGISIQFCNITADTDLLPFVNSTYTYLGRPWKLYSRTIIMQSYMSDVIRPEGWLEWNGDIALDTLFYAEYLNYGPGAGLEKRVTWPGYKILNNTSQANNFTVAQFVEGNLWLPSTGVKYTAGFGV